MIYLLVQTFIWLLLAAAIGFVVAWLLRGMGLNAKLAQLRSNCAALESTREADCTTQLTILEALNAERNEAETELLRLRKELDVLTLRAQEEDIAADHDPRRDLEQELADLRSRYAALEATRDADRAAHLSVLEALNAEHNEAEAKNVSLRAALDAAEARYLECERKRDA